MLNYQNFSNWTGTSVQSQPANNVKTGGAQRALSSFMAKFLSLLFA